MTTSPCVVAFGTANQIMIDQDKANREGGAGKAMPRIQPEQGLKVKNKQQESRAAMIGVDQ